MKFSRVLPVLFFLTACAALAADEAPQIELRGIVAAGGASRFALAVPGGSETAWVTVGESFAGWTLSDYRATDDTLVLAKDGRRVSVRLSSSAVGITVSSGPAVPMTESTRATLADAEEVLNKMKFDQMIGRTLKAQQESMSNVVKQLAAPAGGETSDEERAFHAKLMETVMAGLTTEAMRGDLARAYSEVYSKEELRAIANFYASPAGQAMADKAPEVAARSQAAMLPRIMAATSRAQQLAKDHAAELAAAKLAPAAK
ncbi:MAG: DUF2059 domain-containing protein [Verrucomicrobiota bacterium]